MSLVEQLRFRGYEAGDFEPMYRLDEVCFEPEFRFSRPMMRRMAESHRARVRIAESDGAWAGFVIVHVEKLHRACAGYVATLDVAPEWRRRGVAAALMQQAERQVREAGCASMLLHVYTGNEGAVRFYEQQGFERGHTIESFYGEGLDAWTYRKALI